MKFCSFLSSLIGLSCDIQNKTLEYQNFMQRLTHVRITYWMCGNPCMVAWEPPQLPKAGVYCEDVESMYCGVESFVRQWISLSLSVWSAVNQSHCVHEIRIVPCFQHGLFSTAGKHHNFLLPQSRSPTKYTMWNIAIVMTCFGSVTHYDAVWRTILMRR